MRALPLKPGYGPTLGQVLAPRWRAAARPLRAVAILAGVLLLTVAVWGVLALLPTRYSHGGDLPFGFSYRGLHRTAAGPGEYVRIERRSASGMLEDSYAVLPLQLAPYGGSVSGELPLAAALYARGLRERFQRLRLEGEGKTRISSTLGGYHILYSAYLDGRRVWGRDVMLLPERPRALRGVVVEMLSSQPATVAKPVASSGVLERPLKTFSFG